MRVAAASQQEILVSLTNDEFRLMTGIRLSDHASPYGSHRDKLPKDITGIDYDLKSFIDAIQNVRFAAEVKSKVMEDLKYIAEKLDRAYYPLEKFDPPKAEPKDK